MKSKTSEKMTIRYSKKYSDKQVLVEGSYSETHHWTLILENRDSLRELGDLITAVRKDLGIAPDCSCPNTEGGAWM